jgi:hypothetical protein
MTKVGRRAFLVAIMIAFACYGCKSNRYEIQRDSQGRTVRLDKETGEIAIVEGDKLIKVEEKVGSPKEENPFDKVLVNQPRVWPEISIPQIGVSRVALVTVYREGRISYKLSLQPVPHGWKTRSRLTTFPFTLKFLDAAGLEVVSHSPLSGEVTNVVNPTGQVVGLEIDSNVQCRMELFEQVASWNLTWQF